MTKICTKCGNKLEDEDNFCPNCGASLIDRKEKRKAEKKLKELTGGFLPSGIYQEILEKNNIPLNQGMKIKNNVKKEIKSGKLSSSDVENRIIDLLVNYSIKQDEEEKELRDTRKANEKLKTENRELKTQNTQLKQTQKEQEEKQENTNKELKRLQEANEKLKTEKQELKEQEDKQEKELNKLKQANEKLKNKIRKSELIKILENSNLTFKSKNKLKIEINKGNIVNKTELRKQIKEEKRKSELRRIVEYEKGKITYSAETRIIHKIDDNKIINEKELKKVIKEEIANQERRNKLHRIEKEKGKYHAKLGYDRDALPDNSHYIGD